MTGCQAIRQSLQTTRELLHAYVSDLSDADLLVRPVPGANHIAWQLGHLILAEQRLAAVLPGGLSYPSLPAGFAAQHSKEKAAQEPPQGFSKKSEYLDLFDRTRAVTLSALAQMTDSDLDRPNPGPMRDLAPTLGDLFLLQAHHVLMHAGQFSVLRRKLGKPLLF
jgi:uncharacterized damage-inducible protein DinB